MSEKQRLITANTRFDQTLLKMIDELEEQQKDPSIGATATADKILEGFTAAVNGALLTGTMPEGLTPEMFGCRRMAVDKFTYTSRTALHSVTWYHSLGTRPKLVLAVPSKLPTVNADMAFYRAITWGTGNGQADVVRYYSTSSSYVTSAPYSNVNDTYIKPTNGANDSAYLEAGVEFSVITMA